MSILFRETIVTDRPGHQAKQDTERAQYINLLPLMLAISILLPAIDIYLLLSLLYQNLKRTVCGNFPKYSVLFHHISYKAKVNYAAVYVKSISSFSLMREAFLIFFEA